MKPLAGIILASFLSPLATAVQLVRSNSSGSLAQQGNRAVTDVVRMLQTMLDKAKAEGESERTLYAKFKCYCDDNEKEKKEAIETATKNIQLLEAEIEDLLGSNGELSQQVAALQANMDKNAQARTDAQTLRDNENTAYLAEKADLDAAVGQLGDAIGALAAIGGDQTLASEAHTKFMAGYNASALVSLASSVKEALLASGATLKPGLREKVEAFLQKAEAGAPFTGVYTAQSGEVVGILKQMLETFQTNLADAAAAEALANKTHVEWDATKESEWNTMDGSKTTKSGLLGTNDGDLGTKRTSLSTEKQTKSDSEDFLELLTPMCEDKAKDYEQREQWRTRESAIIAEAIALLNSDHAFDSFGKVTATSFLQVADSRSEPSRSKFASAGKPASTYLQEAARKQHSARLARVANMLATGNPFHKVFAEIEKIKKVLAAEAQQDVEMRDWCVDERTSTDGSITTKNGEIQGLETAITQLGEDIDHPDTGLKATIKEHEDSLEQNMKAMSDETDTRRKENLLYQEKVADCVEAAALLERAQQLLSKFYGQLKKDKQEYYTSLVQATPAPPATWDNEYAGFKDAGGSDVVALLGTIRDNTITEETGLHTTEMTAQHTFEDFMQGLTDQNKQTQKDLATSKKNLAEKEQELGEKRAEKDDTEKQVIELQRYLESIKPGCDFIAANFATRKTNRDNEEAALDLAKTKIEASPAYSQAEAQATVDGWAAKGCKEVCTKDEIHVDCKACLKDISVPGYCAANPSTSGCT